MQKELMIPPIYLCMCDLFCINGSLASRPTNDTKERVFVCVCVFVCER
jgi:hypothetical protein